MIEANESRQKRTMIARTHFLLIVVCDDGFSFEKLVVPFSLSKIWLMFDEVGSIPGVKLPFSGSSLRYAEKSWREDESLRRFFCLEPGKP